MLIELRCPLENKNKADLYPICNRLIGAIESGYDQWVYSYCPNCGVFIAFKDANDNYIEYKVVPKGHHIEMKKKYKICL